MDKQKKSTLFRFVKWCIKILYPKFRAEGVENLPAEPVIIVANHCQTYGPVVGELYVPGEPYIWCAGEMMHLEDVPEYAFRDFWSQKPKWTHSGYKLLSYLIAPLAVCIFTNARTIGVYHDSRILSTFKNTLKKLQEGKNIVIFPEHDVRHNQIVYEFQDKFIDVAKQYYKRTGKALQFVPMYIAPNLRTFTLGAPICYNPEADMVGERSRICRYLMDEITAIGESMPEHTVIPYRNIPKKEYPSNKPKEDDYEKTGS